MKPRLKVCCIASIEEAKLAIKYGATGIGLVSEMPSGPGIISEDKILEISQSLPDSIATFLLTSKTSATEIIAQAQRCKVNTIQLTDDLKKGSYSEIKQALPGTSLVKVIHVTGPESIEKAVEVASQVDFILLDSGQLNSQVKQLGGTGKTHDWALSAAIVEKATIPVFLAGGLKPSNILDAVKAVNPYGVDLCSGVRTEGQLDENKLREFTANLWPGPRSI